MCIYMCIYVYMIYDMCIYNSPLYAGCWPLFRCCVYLTHSYDMNFTYTTHLTYLMYMYIISLYRYVVTHVRYDGYDTSYIEHLTDKLMRSRVYEVKR